MKGFFAEGMCFQPGGGFAVKICHLVGLVPFEASTQQIGEEGMVTEPLTGRIERDQEKIMAYQLLQNLRVFSLPTDGGAQVSVEALQNGGA
ncbi:hypothetical protein SDC9_194624 [bioreactor metagenome]|uniref:Uncharacterized protein n=1 Tax=bioreactor metagenome TaxID=1076179 RepID=A0A645IFF0_9ZZZZ